MTAYLEQAGYVLDAHAKLWCKPDYGSISYSDGDEAEERLHRILKQASDLSVLSSELRTSCTDWPSTYHLSGTRANILRPSKELLQGDILEVGAGCGAITRFLGETGANVYALEGSYRRASIARERTRDLSNVTVIAERFDDFRSEQRFDVITLIGVLEYANLFTGGADPHCAMLERIRSLLKPSGTIIIAIENQLGLKYFAGAPEDHLGQPMYGIEGRYRNDQPQTFGREVLTEMLQRSGYRASQFLAPFPDYKLPVVMISEAGMQHKGFDAAALAAQTVRRDPQLPPYCNFALELAWPLVFDNGIALDLANSFLIIASPSDEALNGPDALAYHYSTDRLAPYCKETTFRAVGADVEVIYTPLGPRNERDPAPRPKVLEFHCPTAVAYSKGKSLALDFIHVVTRETWSIDEVGAFLRDYVRRLEQLAGRAAGSLAGDAVLPGMFFDILPQNIIVKADGDADIIDKEWSTAEDVAVQRLLFRTLLWMSGAVTAFGTETTVGVATRAALIRHGLNAAGYPLTDERYETFIELESVAQSQVTGMALSDFIRRWIESPLPRHSLSQAMVARDSDLAERDRQIANLTNAQVAHDAAYAQQIAQRDQEIAQRDREIAQRDQDIAQHDQEIAHCDHEIAQRDQEVMERDHEIARLVGHEVEQAQGMVERDLEIERLRNQVETDHQRLRAADAALTEQIQTVHALSTTVEELRYAGEELQRIRDTKLFRLRDALASRGFGPRQIAKVGYRSAALVTPRALVNSLGPAVARLRRAWGATPIERIPADGLATPGDAATGRSPGTTQDKTTIPPDFDAAFYLRAYPDVRESGADPYEHYVLYGKKEGRLPSVPRRELHADEPFDAAFYLRAYPDVRESGVDPYEHYVLYGKKEGRLPSVPQRELHADEPFDAAFYLRAYPDVRESGADPYEHYVLYGKKEGRLPSVPQRELHSDEPFDADFYLRAYPDVRESGVDPYEHYVLYGKNEGRLSTVPRPELYADDSFDADFYLRQYPDVGQSGEEPYEHYFLYGKHEGRLATAPTENPDFDEAFYLLQYPDIREAGVDPYQHFLFHGKAEGRAGVPPVVAMHLGPAGIVAGRETVLVVTHEASRSGAPILSLNIIRHLREFNVVSLLLGDGPLMGAFQAASAVTVGPTRIRGNQIAGTYVVEKLLETFRFSFAITNSVESAVVLRGLAQYGVPTVSLIHEFAAYTRPLQAFPEAFRWASESVFSANVTYENAVSMHPDLADAPYHVLPQGRCEIDADEAGDRHAHANADEEVHALLRPAGTTADTVVILGLGTVQLRKGVDLFLDCAARVLRANPDGDFRFVWFGKGYDPEGDLQYSAYLVEQIRRSGLEKHVALFDETPSIEAVYRQADILLVTSRLDPLPNVAIDSMTGGLPVLCFDKATGIADILRAGGLGDTCLSPYLDTERMAAHTAELIRSKPLRKSIGEQCRQLALKTFDMVKYVEELKRLASAAVDLVEQQKKDVETIVASGVLRSDFFDVPAAADRSIEVKALEHVRSWATGVNRRKAMPGFDPGVYIEQSSSWREDVDPTASFLREGCPDGPWNYEVITEHKPAKAIHEGTRVALHVHAFYADLLMDMMNALNRNGLRPDLFVSIGEATDSAQVDSALRLYTGRVAEVSVVPNKGRDIGPFLTQFGQTFADGYDIVGHLHTKKTVDLETESVGKNWYRFLLLNLLGDGRKMADIIVSQLANDASLGLVFPDDPHEVGWGKNRTFAEPLAQRLNIDPLPRHFTFPVGTMFWAKTDALRPLFDLRLGWQDYPAEPLPYDGSMLHALERLLPFVVAKQGYRIAASNVSGVSR
ncbi:rhamnan synthesis F family protein [Caballeronia sp. RCC_10]|uniref:rhamnan synthesis F family protein n=1 Tax=Caballeronia sp. RCC_10 TaxID=3239227 RepID=UPI003524AA98